MIHTKGRTPLAALLFAIAIPLAALGQEGEGARLDSEIQKAKAEMAQARKDAAKADAELRKTDSLLREESSRAVAAEERQAKDRDRREKENASLQARLQETQAKINAERSGMGRFQNNQDEIKARQKRLSLVLAGYCDSVAARIEAGPPMDRETRIDRVKSLKKDLEAGSASMEEGFARLNAVIKEEIKGGDEIALFNKPVTRKNGDVVNAQVLKIGNQWVVYMDDEGQRFGVLERRQTANGAWAWDWREDPGFEEKNRIKAALEVKSAKRPPQLALLDLGLATSAPAASAPAPSPAAASQPVEAAPVKGGK
ncbi:MAG: hypothetical protein JWP91_691 [Fibrobacteres bacterium]|nr:hypothetical protein [Fibrobacterota bacterium]